MLSSLLHPSRSFRRGRQRDHSPFSSPFTSASSPVATRRGETSERRRPAARYDDELSEDEEYDEDDVDEAMEGEYEETPEDFEEEDEDGLEETTPLLPIFSAAHLGTEISWAVRIHNVLY